MDIVYLLTAAAFAALIGGMAWGCARLGAKP
jgi:hypothetical protein